MWPKRRNNPYRHGKPPIKKNELVKIVGLQLWLEWEPACTRGPQDKGREALTYTTNPSTRHTHTHTLIKPGSRIAVSFHCVTSSFCVLYRCAHLAEESPPSQVRLAFLSADVRGDDDSDRAAPGVTGLEAGGGGLHSVCWERGFIAHPLKYCETTICKISLYNASFMFNWNTATQIQTGYAMLNGCSLPTYMLCNHRIILYILSVFSQNQRWWFCGSLLSMV